MRTKIFEFFAKFWFNNQWNIGHVVYWKEGEKKYWGFEYKQPYISKGKFKDEDIDKMLELPFKGKGKDKINFGSVVECKILNSHLRDKYIESLESLIDPRQTKMF